MKTPPQLRIRFVAFILLSFPVALLANLKLTFDVVQETSTPARPNSEASHATKTFPLTVLLSDQAFSSTGGPDPTFIDFTTRQSYRVDPSKESFSVISLYANIGFREAELRNRLGLAQSLVAARVPDNLFDRVLFESALSLRAPNSTPLEPAVSDERISYTHGEKSLAFFSRAGFELTEPEAAQFIRFLRYSYSTHPDILARLQTLRLVPREFEIHRYDAATDRFRLILTKAERVTEPVSSVSFLKNLKPSLPASPELRTALALESGDFKTRVAAARKSAVSAAQSKRYLDALLLFFEASSLSTGEQLPPEFATYKAAIESDPDCRRFFTTRRTTTPAASEQAVKTLIELESKTTAGRPVLKILRANLLTSLRRPAEAQRLILEALTEKPHILGAWRDLGFLYGSNFRMDLAWQWWDAARRLLPGSSQWKPMEDLEQRLAREYPEFF